MKSFLCVQLARASEGKKISPTSLLQAELLTLQVSPSFKIRQVDIG